MNKNPLIGALAAVLALALIAPAAFFASPLQAQAAGGGVLGAAGCIGGIMGIGSGAASVVTGVMGVPVSNLIIQSQTTISAGANATSCINDTILMPLARAVARMILQQITASTINWVTGRNGTGQPSFVQNLGVHLQLVGDSAALPFITQVATGFNSPFGPAIASSLRTTYLQRTSMGGFFAANQNTLSQYSPNPSAFLAGNWSQGGVREWFALTTQDQNNPYALNQAARDQMLSTAGEAQTNRRQDLVQSGGFLSWCGADATPSASANPKAPCTNPDGTPAMAQTPGSVILGYTQKTLGSGLDQLVSAQDLDSALGAIATALVNQVLGGSGGLFGASTAPAGRPSVTNRLQNYTPTNQSASTSGTSIVQSTLDKLSGYTATWDTLRAAANTASTTLADLASFCIAQQQLAPAILAPEGDTTQALTTFITDSTAQATAARSAITTVAAPVLREAQAAYETASTTRVFALQVQSESLGVSTLTSATTDAAMTLNTDIQTLSTMPPTVVDVGNVQMDATVTNTASASPAGTLSVSGGTLIDRLNLITANARALKTSVCTPAPPQSFNNGE